MEYFYTCLKSSQHSQAQHACSLACHFSNDSEITAYSKMHLHHTLHLQHTLHIPYRDASQVAQYTGSTPSDAEARRGKHFRVTASPAASSAARANGTEATCACSHSYMRFRACPHIYISMHRKSERERELRSNHDLFAAARRDGGGGAAAAGLETHPRDQCTKAANSRTYNPAVSLRVCAKEREWNGLGGGDVFCWKRHGDEVFRQDVITFFRFSDLLDRILIFILIPYTLYLFLLY